MDSTQVWTELCSIPPRCRSFVERFLAMRLDLNESSSSARLRAHIYETDCALLQPLSLRPTPTSRVPVTSHPTPSERPSLSRLGSSPTLWWPEPHAARSRADPRGQGKRHCASRDRHVASLTSSKGMCSAKGMACARASSPPARNQYFCRLFAQ